MTLSGWTRFTMGENETPCLLWLELESGAIIDFGEAHALDGSRTWSPQRIDREHGGDFLGECMSDIERAVKRHGVVTDEQAFRAMSKERAA